MNSNKLWLVKFSINFGEPLESIYDANTELLYANDKREIFKTLLTGSEWYWLSSLALSILQSDKYTPIKEQKKIESIKKKLRVLFDDKNIEDTDLEDKERFFFIQENLEDFIYLLNVYEECGCDYLSVEEVIIGKFI